MSAKLSAIVLAGGTATAEFTAATGAVNRALAEIAPGRTMIEFVLDALNGAVRIGSVVVVGDIPQADAFRDVEIAAPGDSLIDNILIGLASSGSDREESVLLVSADIPFITSDAIDDFAGKATQTGGDFCYPIISMADYNREFAGMKRTTLKLREGRFTGGNIMLVRAGILTANPDAIRAAYAGRKSVLRIGSMLGWGLLMRIIASQVAFPTLLTIPLLEEAVSRFIGSGASARAIITRYASIGTDVDKAADVVFARARLQAIER